MFNCWGVQRPKISLQWCCSDDGKCILFPGRYRRCPPRTGRNHARGAVVRLTLAWVVNQCCGHVSMSKTHRTSLLGTSCRRSPTERNRDSRRKHCLKLGCWCNWSYPHDPVQTLGIMGYTSLSTHSSCMEIYRLMIDASSMELYMLTRHVNQ